MLLKDLTYDRAAVARDSEFVGSTYVELEEGHKLGIDKFVRADGRIEFDMVLYSPEEDWDALSFAILIDYGFVDPVQAQCILHEWTAGDADAA